MAELDKRLDLDIDALLESPTLRVKLSPAELDKQLLELYDAISESPGGDILRVIGGGGPIGMQNLYMRRHAERKWWRRMKSGQAALDIFPSYVDDDDIAQAGGSASQRVRWSLRRNIPTRMRKKERQKNTPKMYCASPYEGSNRLRTWTGLRPPHHFGTKVSLLI